jgi:hypothetical protein
MFLSECVPNRRNFLKGGVGVALGFATLALFLFPRPLLRTHGLSGRNQDSRLK